MEFLWLAVPGVLTVVALWTMIAGSRTDRETARSWNARIDAVRDSA